MSEPFVGEISLFAGNFAPRGWAFCNGQLLPISPNTALFSILGTTYGGDGRTTFGLPDLQERFPMGPGSGPGLPAYRLGQQVGETQVTLSEQQVPGHTHTFAASEEDAGTDNPAGAYVATVRDDAFSSAAADATMQAAAVGSVGGGQAHENVHPYQTVNYIIALQGLYPSRS